MRRRGPNIFSFFAIALLLVFNACTSLEQDVARRRHELLAAYPPGITTRAKVQKRWSPIQAGFSERRPDLGWDGCPSALVRARVAASEQRTGHNIYLCERYFWPGLSGSLSYYWFYYDDRDYLVDAEWQWHTD
jgi:hypothetical protein